MEGAKIIEKKLFVFNIIFFILPNILFLIFSLTRGWKGAITFLGFLSIHMVFLLAYILLRKKFSSIFVGIIFFVLTLINYFIVFITITFLRDAIEMDYSLMNISRSIIPFFFKNMLGISRLLFFTTLLLLFILISLYIADKKRFDFLEKISLKKIIIILIISLIFIILLSTTLRGTVYNPYINLIPSGEKQVGISLENISIEMNEVIYNNNLEDYDFEKRKYDYAFVFVMEQTSLEDFYEEKSSINLEDDFFERTKNKTHFFKNYYTSNQDSRTAVWEMMNSFFIPIESYVEPWQDYYGYLLETKNMIEYLKINGVNPYSVSSVGTESLILGVYPFNEFINLENYAESEKKYLCSTAFSYQKGCEDFAIFEDFTNHILKNKEKDLFYFQELIFGHGEKYMSISGKERVQYYNDYFNAFYGFLEKENIINQSIIVIVADHGPKGGGPRYPSDFNIPMMVIAQDLEPEEKDLFYSHFSFKDIFLSYYLGTELPEEEKLIYLIGQTGRDRIGYIDIINGISILGKTKEDLFFTEGKNLKGIDIYNLKEKLNYLKKYEEYVIKISIENHTNENFRGYV